MVLLGAKDGSIGDVGVMFFTLQKLQFPTEKNPNGTKSTHMFLGNVSVGSMDIGENE